MNKLFIEKTNGAFVAYKRIDLCTGLRFKGKFNHKNVDIQLIGQILTSKQEA